MDRRKAKYERLQEQLNQTEQTQISTTDADARSLPLHMRIVEVGYNLQSAVDDNVYPTEIENHIKEDA